MRVIFFRLKASCPSVGLTSGFISGGTESFDVELSDWMTRASDNKKARLTGLCNILGLKYPPDLSLRYQLFHRTASALITAQTFKTDIAIMLVHSFSQNQAWFEDYAAFAKALGIKAPKRGIFQKIETR